MITTVKKYLKAAYEAEPLLDRAYIYLEDGDRDKASEYFDKVLDKNPREPFAYLGKLIISEGMEDVADLLLWERSYTENPDFVKILRFSEGELHDAFERLAAERDNAEEGYKRAVEKERTAQTADDLAEAYSLFAPVRDYADAEDRMLSLQNAASVIRYYAKMGKELADRSIAATEAFCQKTQAQIDQIIPVLNMEKVMVADIPKTVSRLTSEMNSLGIFKGKRKRELAEQIEAEQKKLVELEENIKGRREAVRKLSAELDKAQAALQTRGLFADYKDIADDKAVDATPEDGVLTYVSYKTDKEPRSLLANPEVLALVAKDAAALFAIIRDEKALAAVVKNKTNAAAVGSSPAFGEVAKMSLSIIKNQEKLVPYLPLKARLLAESENGDTVTFGMFPKDGKDPYAFIIPMPGTPIERTGVPVKWRVIGRENDGKRLTLICEKPLLFRPFEPTCRDDMTWKNSDMRKYMQGEMLGLLFDSTEREAVVPMKCSYNNETCTDMLMLPSFDEVKKVRENLPREGFIWTRDSIEITYYNSSILTQVSMYSLNYNEKYNSLVFNGGGLLPVVKVDLA